jgi:hypothetical protein
VASVFTQILWWLGIALEILILVRSVKGNSCQKYPAFYLYLGTLLLIELLRFSVYTFKPRFYGPFYWYTEFLATTVAYAVILEVYKHALINSPGVARIARTFLWGVLGAVILKATLNAVTKLVWSPATTHAELERDLYAVQALLLAGIIALLAYYAVATGRNMGHGQGGGLFSPLRIWPPYSSGVALCGLIPPILRRKLSPRLTATTISSLSRPEGHFPERVHS